MEIIVAENYEEMSEKAAEIVADFIKQKPACVLGLATGSTPVRMYEMLAEKCKKGEISFKQVFTFNLDDYLGLDFKNDQSYHSVMYKNLFSRIDIDIKNTFFPNDFAPNFEDYDRKIEEIGGIDLQILGIGTNGHIGFNEPGSLFNSKTREVLLSENTIKDNSRFFSARGGAALGGSISLVPTKAATMGIETIMKAKKIILLANTQNKAEIIKKTVSGSIVPEVPASILQKHNNVIIVLDKEAARDLKA